MTSGFSSAGLPLDLSRPVPAGVVGASAWRIDHRIPAGFPSPAEDLHVSRVELTQLLGCDAEATYLLRIQGDSMVGAGIFDGDIVVVNKLLQPCHHDIVVALIDNEFTCKRLQQQAGRSCLVAENPAYPGSWPRQEQTLEIWGVVTAALKLFRRPVQRQARR